MHDSPNLQHYFRVLVMLRFLSRVTVFRVVPPPPLLLFVATTARGARYRLPLQEGLINVVQHLVIYP
jgi:hypothetical protein